MSDSISFKPIFLMLLILGFFSLNAHSQEIDSTYAPSPFDHLGENMVWSLVGWPLGLHVAGGLATYGMIESDMDAQIHRYAVDQNIVLNTSLYGPGILVSTLAPIAVPLSLYYFPSDNEWKANGAVAIQAVGISFLYNNVLKAITSRAPPDIDSNDPEGLSRDFKFGFLRRGIFYGWPSGHTMTNTALVTSLFAYNRDKSWASYGFWAALGYSTYVGVSMTLGARGSAHWASEAVAGFLMGAGIGWTVGDSFYQDKMKNKNKSSNSALSRLKVFPVIGNGAGVLAFYTF